LMAERSSGRESSVNGSPDWRKLLLAVGEARGRQAFGTNLGVHQRAIDGDLKHARGMLHVHGEINVR
jgi:hypothetical protein